MYENRILSKKPIAKISSTLDFNNTGGNTYRIWYNSDNFLTLSKRSIFKITYSNKSQIYVQKPNSSKRQAIAKMSSSLDSKYKGVTPCQVWFNLDISMIRSKPQGS